MARKPKDRDKKVFVTDDKAIRHRQVLSEADVKIIEEVETGKGLVTKSIDEFKELCRPMTLEQAKMVRRLRVDEGLSWRAVAQMGQMVSSLQVGLWGWLAASERRLLW